MQVEIWSDIACPWCYLGKRRLETALARFDHADEVDVVWRSFQLDPSLPPRYDGDLTEMLKVKLGGSAADVTAMNERMTGLAAAEGLDYHLGAVQPGNTFDAHRIVHLAAAHGLGDAAKERMFAAYFTEGLAVGDHETLVRLAVEIGLDADEVRAALAGEAYGAEVFADMEEARALGVTGVPFFVLDRTYAVSGAQSADLILSALGQAWDASGVTEAPA